MLGSRAATGARRAASSSQSRRPSSLRPAVILEAGIHDSSDSTPVEMPRTLPGMATDLRALLRKSGIRGPYALVGHSFGGMIVRLFAQTYPSKVAGLVLVDSFGTNIRSLFGPDLWPGYVELLNQPGTALDSDPSFETIDIDGAIDAVLQAPSLPRIPLAVMSKTEPFATAPGVSPAILARSG
jgi:pimeloyl-ACP methyl ester carboxylesterase